MQQRQVPWWEGGHVLATPGVGGAAAATALPASGPVSGPRGCCSLVPLKQPSRWHTEETGREKDQLMPTASGAAWWRPLLRLRRRSPASYHWLAASHNPQHPAAGQPGRLPLLPHPPRLCSLAAGAWPAPAQYPSAGAAGLQCLPLLRQVRQVQSKARWHTTTGCDQG